jgi:hypothetical protein
METLINYGKPWKEQEDNQLNDLYSVHLLDIMEISKIHKRGPWEISSRLLKKYITNLQSERGYTKYWDNIISGVARFRFTTHRSHTGIIHRWLAGHFISI